MAYLQPLQFVDVWCVCQGCDRWGQYLEADGVLLESRRNFCQEKERKPICRRRTRSWRACSSDIDSIPTRTEEFDPLTEQKPKSEVFRSDAATQRASDAMDQMKFVSFLFQWCLYNALCGNLSWRIIWELRFVGFNCITADSHQILYILVDFEKSNISTTSKKM